MADTVDAELTSLISKLKGIEKELHGGKIRNGDVQTGKVDRFLDLYDEISERLTTINHATEQLKVMGSGGVGDGNIDRIKLQSQVRSELSAATEEFQELETLQKIEVRKKRSKFKQGELDQRQTMVTHLAEQLQFIREVQRSGFSKTYQPRFIERMEDNELFRGPPQPPANGDVEMGTMNGSYPPPPSNTGGPGGRGFTILPRGEMTDHHRQQLLLIRERDQKIDEEIVEIGKGVDVLHELAKGMNEEVKMQNIMLDSLDEKMQNAQEKIFTVNERLKETLEKARSSDKLCVDIFCIILLIGMIIVLYKITTS